MFRLLIIAIVLIPSFTFVLAETRNVSQDAGSSMCLSYLNEIINIYGERYTRYYIPVVSYTENLSTPYKIYLETYLPGRNPENFYLSKNKRLVLRNNITGEAWLLQAKATYWSEASSNQRYIWHDDGIFDLVRQKNVITDIPGYIHWLKEDTLLIWNMSRMLIYYLPELNPVKITISLDYHFDFYIAYPYFFYLSSERRQLNALNLETYQKFSIPLSFRGNPAFFWQDGYLNLFTDVDNTVMVFQVKDEIFSLIESTTTDTDLFKSVQDLPYHFTHFIDGEYDLSYFHANTLQYDTLLKNITYYNSVHVKNKEEVILLRDNTPALYLIEQEEKKFYEIFSSSHTIVENQFLENGFLQVIEQGTGNNRWLKTHWFKDGLHYEIEGTFSPHINATSGIQVKDEQFYYVDVVNRNKILIDTRLAFSSYFDYKPLPGSEDWLFSWSDAKQVGVSLFSPATMTFSEIARFPGKKSFNLDRVYPSYDNSIFAITFDIDNSSYKEIFIVNNGKVINAGRFKFDYDYSLEWSKC